MRVFTPLQRVGCTLALAAALAAAGAAGPLAPGPVEPAGQTLPNAVVQEMVAGLTRAELEPAVRELSGETVASVGGKPHRFRTRSSESGAEIDRVEEYLHERLSSYGLDKVAYESYPGAGLVEPGRNVIGEITGATHPNEIVIVGAHMDSRPWNGRSPGADDDASGVSAVLYLARAFAGKRFDRTVRLCLFGSEENAPWEVDDGFTYGSGHYASRLAQARENVVAMVEADGLAVNRRRRADMHTRSAGRDPGGREAAIYRLWREVIQTYGIRRITPRHSPDDLNWSDHGAFWQWYPAVPAVLIIEDDTGNHPTWHTPRDRVSTFNWPFYVAISRSLAALVAHIAGPF